MSTSSVVSLPSAAIWAAKALRSSSCSSVNACAAVPPVGTPNRRPASRFDVAANPAMYAARAAATAASSWVRREPISMQGRSPAAEVIRDAADAMALSWLRMLSTSVSSTTPCAKSASTTSTGEPGK